MAIINPQSLRNTGIAVFTGTPSFVSVNDGIISELNSYHGTLASGQSFEGAFENITDFGGIRVSVYSSSESAEDGLELWGKAANVDHAYIDDVYTVEAGVRKTYAVPVSTPNFKLRYTAGSENITDLEISTIYQKNVSIPSSHRIKDSVSDQDDAQLIQSVTKAKRPNGEYRNIDATINGNLAVGIGDIQADAGARVRVSQFTTLGDYKILGYDHTNLWENVGTGTGTWEANKYNMSVTAGQWFIKNSIRPHQYFSGKSQAIEMTFDNFHPQTGISKRCGYFSSSIASPYSADLDGLWLESDGTTIRFRASRNGTETMNLPITSWDGYEFLDSYQNMATWENFTVIFMDFLWLGGAIVRLWLKTQYGFVLAHTLHYSGTSEDVFILSPNQPIRYEIRSTSGSGNFRYICAQVSTEGSTAEAGVTHGINTGSAVIPVSVVGTKYPVLAIKKQTTLKNLCAKIDTMDVLVATNNDLALWSLEINPTLSAPLTYTTMSGTCMEFAAGNGTITVASPGKVIANGFAVQGNAFPTDILRENFLSYLGGKLDGTQDAYVLCLTPLTASINSYATINVKEY